MKRISKILIALAVIFAIAVTACFTGKTLLFNEKLKVVNYWTVRAYTGDRISINMLVTVDGKPAEVVNNKQEYRLKYNGETTTLKDHASNYDTYEYPLLIKYKNGDIPLNITVNHWNWWEIVESNLYIDIDTKSNTYTTHEKYKYTAEAHASPVYYYISHECEPEETFSYIDSINLYAGCKG